MIGYCLVAVMLSKGKFVDYLVPNCDPRRESFIACKLLSNPNAQLRQQAICFDEEKNTIVYAGEISRSQET